MARLWDLRTGRALLTLTGHVKQALCLDFSPNGYQFATGSDDHTVRIWDLRKKKSLYTIPAHSALVTNIRYQVRWVVHSCCRVNDDTDCSGGTDEPVESLAWRWQVLGHVGIRQRHQGVEHTRLVADRDTGWARRQGHGS